MKSAHGLAITAATVILGACTVDLWSPTAAPPDRLTDGPVRVSLEVTPRVLDPPGTVTATLTYENLSAETVVLASSYGCVSFASVLHEGRRIPFPATQYYCTTAVSYRDLEPGVPLTSQWPLVVGGEHGIEVPAATYRFVARLNTHSRELETTFRVR